jgi:hypothetical protein
VERVTAEPGKLVIKFGDQSTMRAKTAGIADMFPPGGQIKAVQEDGAQFTLQFEDGSTVTLQLADPGASVALWDKAGGLKDPSMTSRAETLESSAGMGRRGAVTRMPRAN